MAPAVRRPATSVEFAALTEAVAGRSVHSDADLTIVFCYPGLGVGHHYPELAGCTSQLLQVGAARAALEPLGVGVCTVSAEEAGNRGELPPHIRAIAGSIDSDLAAQLPHVVHGTQTYLTRTTWFLGRTEATVVESIDDPADHVHDVIDEVTRSVRADPAP